MILKSLSVGGTTAGGVTLTVTMWYNPVTAAKLAWLPRGNESASSYSTTETSVTTTGLVPLFSILLSDNASEIVNLDDLRIVIPPNNEIVITVISTANINRAGAALTWLED